MVAFRALFSERLRRGRRDRRAKKTARSARWSGVDLVGSPPQFPKAGEGNAAGGETSHRNQATRSSSAGASRTGAEQAASLDHLPDNKARNADGELTHSGDQRQGKSRVSRNAQKTAHKKITAFLHAQAARNGKRGGANRQSHALQNERIDKCGWQTER